MDEFEVEATRLVEDEVARLRGLSHAEATSLPEVNASDVVIAGKAASLTAFRYIDEGMRRGHTLIVVLAARPQFFGMASRHLERGLVFSPLEEVRDATATELQNSGG
jgi:hypothetical protein